MDYRLSSWHALTRCACPLPVLELILSTQAPIVATVWFCNSSLHVSKDFMTVSFQLSSLANGWSYKNTGHKKTRPITSPHPHI